MFRFLLWFYAFDGGKDDRAILFQAACNNQDGAFLIYQSHNDCMGASQSVLFSKRTWLAIEPHTSFALLGLAQIDGRERLV
jgi:hypothetical protein